MPVRRMYQFKGHRSSPAEGIKVTAGSTEAAFTTKRNNFEFTAKITAKESMTIGIVTAMKHFINIFKNSITNVDAAVCNSIKMIAKNSL